MKPKNFDCVQTMRRIRDKLSLEIEGLSCEELIRWVQSHQYADPFLKRLAEKAARQAAGADETPPRKC